ncbi:MoxR family ATPase [Streptomyces sp. NPDC046931]|uniref:AAA family ATPase n=1 Tax=Streptomyces sp. NPDC046931 TaxID=3154806 RepID=UPI0033E429CA
MNGADSPGGLFGHPHDALPVQLPPGPPWRRFGPQRPKRPAYVIRPEDTDVVNAALQLRRPLLVTGFPGVGKSSLAYAIADDLGLGEVLHWAVNSRSVLTEALYRYDAVSRLRDATASADSGRRLPVEEYVVLGPLGTALASVPGSPRVLLIDELDKGDIDLPNDLLTVFEDGAFEIPELSRQALETGAATAQVALTRPAPYRAPDTVGETAEDGPQPPSATVVDGWVCCQEFPVVIITSNGERDFPPAFLRRCVRLDLKDPEPEHLKDVVKAQFGDDFTSADEGTLAAVEEMINKFGEAGRRGRLATDQLLNAIHLRLNAVGLDPHVLKAVLTPLDNTDDAP